MHLAGVIGEHLLTHVEYLEEALKKRDEDIFALRRRRRKRSSRI